MTFEQAEAREISTILTSGQKNSCVAGKELLRELVAMEKARSRSRSEAVWMLPPSGNCSPIREPMPSI